MEDLGGNKPGLKLRKEISSYLPCRMPRRREGIDFSMWGGTLTAVKWFLLLASRNELFCLGLMQACDGGLSRAVVKSWGLREES